jgi:hypothetical protein
MYLCILTAILAEKSVCVPPCVGTLASMSFGEKMKSAATHALAAATATLTGCAPYPSAPAQGKTPGSDKLDVVTWNMDRNFNKGVRANDSVDSKMLEHTRQDLLQMLKGSGTKCVVGLQECDGPWLDKVTSFVGECGYKVVRGGRRARQHPPEQS